jgi:uncharacterized membrane protein YbhN (UPF0104 family)
MGKNDPTSENIAKLFAIFVGVYVIYLVYVGSTDTYTISQIKNSALTSLVPAFIVTFVFAANWGMLGPGLYDE